MRINKLRMEIQRDWIDVISDKKLLKKDQQSKNYPFRRDRFKIQVTNIELTGFGLIRSDEALFKNNQNAFMLYL